MSPEAYQVLATNAFPAERRAYYQELADQAELLRSFLQLEAEGERAERRAEGERWARVIGVATETDLGPAARPLEVLLHSCDRAHRERAAAIICRALRRGRETEVA